MLFTDSFFLFYFLPACFGLLFLIGRFQKKGVFGGPSKAVLFGATLFFYGCQETWWLVPFLICVVFDFIWASALRRTRRPSFRKLWLTASIVQNLGLLCLFKYWSFLRASWVGLFPSSDAVLPRLLMDGQAVALPAGISFYTFESLSFVIDVYRRKIEPPKNPLDFAAFIAMFPRFVAGPIVRYSELASQFKNYRGPQWEMGLFLFFKGFCLKALFADQFAVFSRYAFSSDGGVGFIAAWLGLFSYTLQIYFDFSGYSLMAIGLGYCLGFAFPENFNRPYLASSVSDFWHRWHITLSRWLRDYLYIPLGGNRCGRVRTYGNLFLTMLLGGIWHGAGWNFLLWGAWHGGWLCAERAFPALTKPVFANSLRTFFTVMLGWVFFRAKDSAEMGKVWTALFNPLQGISTFNATGLQVHRLSLILCIVGIVYCFVWERRVSALGSFRFRWVYAGAFVFALAVSFSATQIPFLYFQF